MFCLFFFHGLSLGYFESYEETLEKKKGIEKNEFEWNEYKERKYTNWKKLENRKCELK